MFFCGHGRQVGSKQYKIKREKDCNILCKGHVTMKCGETWRASVYKIYRYGEYMCCFPKCSFKDIRACLTRQSLYYSNNAKL